MKNILFACGLLLAFSSVLSAQTPAAGKGRISGVALDSLTAQPVEFATVTLLDQATKQPINGAIADEKGRFSILQVAAGKYTLRLSFLGFDQKELQNVGLGEGQNLNLGTFRLLPSGAALQEVTVTGQKALIEEKVDRLVYNAENDLTSRGGSAADLLQKVPLLSVDLDGNVSLRGSQSITVLINGKPSAIMAGNVADALKQLPANLIKSVEVITSPSAKYDAEGAAGIINIILKKSTLEGFTMNVNGDVGNRGAKLGLNGSYRQGKLGISLGGNGRTNYNRAATTLEQTTLADGITFRTDQTAAANDRPLFGNYTLGIDYDLDSNQSLTAGARFGARNFRRMQRLETDLYENDVLSSSSVRDVNGRDLSPSVDVNLDYLHTFQPRQEWSMATQYSRNKLTNNYDTDFLGEDEAVTSRLKNVNSNLNQEFTLQSDYQTPVTKNQLLEFGAKGIFRRVNSAYQYLFAENAGAVFLPDASRPSGLLDYNQNIGATYVSHTLAAAKKLTFKTGLRYEYTSISAATEESAFSIPAYGVLVPSINLAKTTAAGATFKLGYNRRIQRPGLQQLNPNFNTANPQNVSIGNPNLNPELTDNLEIGLSTHIKQTYLNLSLFGRSTDNAISQVRFASDTLTGALVTTYQNIGKQRMAGANFFGNLYLTANWTLNGSMEVAYSYLQGTAIGLDGTSVTTSNTGFNVNGRLMSQYRFQHGWAVEAFGFMRGAQVQLQGRQGGFGMYKVGVKKDFNNKKGSIGLAAENFLTTGVNIMRTELEAPTFSQISSTHLFNRGFELTFEYNIGKVTATPRKKLRSVKNDDVKEGEN